MIYMHIKTKPGSAYHLWDGKDTACRMYSTKGIKRRKVKDGLDFVCQPPEGKRLCHMCEVNAAKSEVSA